MKTADEKEQFIKLRAEGKSYAQIQKELGIAKGTCISWEKNFKQEIQELKTDRLNELYSTYFMTKEARIEKLGDTLKKINAAIEKVDLSAVAPEKLLDYKLKYIEALKDEYIEAPTAQLIKEGFTAKEILEGLGGLLNRIQSGTVSLEQVSKENTVYSNLLKAYEDVELADKIKALEAILDRRN